MFNVFDIRLISYLTVYMWNAIYNIYTFKSSGKMEWLESYFLCPWLRMTIYWILTLNLNFLYIFFGEKICYKKKKRSLKRKKKKKRNLLSI